MVNFLQRGFLATTAAATALTLGTSAVGAGELPVPPSPTKPNDNSTTLVVPVKAASLPSSSSSPTNPNPPPDQARSLAKFLFVAQVPSQVAQGDKQPSNSPLVTPPTLGRYDAGQIADLEMQKRNAINQFGQGLKDHNQSQNAKLQEILNRIKK